MPGWRALFRLPWGKMIPLRLSDKSLPKSKMDQSTLIPVARDYLVARETTHQGQRSICSETLRF
ncbi:hypothetical protein DENIT_11584 [Pseudomonas veronii]|nr:hypothetical protein DENIT_11584 [Pseudomonas veronii]